MKKTVTLILLCAMILCAIPLIVGAETQTDLFSVQVNSGKAENLLSTSFGSGKIWTPKNTSSRVTLTVADGKKTDGIYIAWMTLGGNFLISARDKNGDTVKEYRPGDQFDGYGNFYPLPDTTKTVEISFTKLTSDCGIAYVKMEEAGAEDPTLMRWNAPREGGVDLMVVPTHQDDEHIFLGGVAPYFLDRGYTVSIAYSVRCSRSRYEEALRGLWAMGFTDYPDFLGYKDGRKDTYQDVIDFWGGDENAILTKFVRLIRKNRPEVIVSHDESYGETNHKQHVATAKLLAQAFEKAADPDFDPESVKTYGVWQAKKYYEHVWKENVIQLDYTKRLQRYGGLTPLEVSAVGYDYHVSQHEYYQVFKGGKNDTSTYGLRLSSVGYDDIDMFYNVKGTDFVKNPPKDVGSKKNINPPKIDMKLTENGVRITPVGGPIPIETTAVTTKIVTTKPVTTKPVTTKIVTTKPVTTTQIPTTETPTTEAPTTQIPTTATPSTTQLVTTTAPVMTTAAVTTTVQITSLVETTPPSTTTPVTTHPVTTAVTGGTSGQRMKPSSIVTGVICFLLLCAVIAVLVILGKMNKNKKQERRQIK